MTVYDLNRDQLEQLKQRMLMDQYDLRGETPSWGELADVDSLISDEEVYDEYAGTEFVPEDFGIEDEDEQEEIYSLQLDYISGDRSYIADTLRAIANSIDNGNYGGIEYDTSWGLDRE